jgi:16S rRNA (cytidine1402-2'-O)-methyltransferase
MLYIVPTPIGNLEDITLRAIRILKDVDLIACEDTRTSKKLLNHYEIKTPTISYHKFNESKRSQELITRLVSGLDLAVISDAGTPGISDPSSYLIKEAISNNIKIDVLPGATATIPALILSGLNTDSFAFCGFLPDKNKDKLNILNQVKSHAETLIFYVSPHSLEKTLLDFHENLGNRNIAIIREISKLFQTTYRGTLSHFIANFDEITLKGEFVVVIEGSKEKVLSDDQILDEARRLISTGKSVSIIAKEMSKEYGLKKNTLYQLFLDNNLQ